MMNLIYIHKMRATLLIAFIILGFSIQVTYAQTKYVNPEGYYELVSKVKYDSSEVYGRFGTINVKSISSTQLYFELDINRGAPSYNNGFAADTLEYKNNQVVFTTDSDSSCVLTLTFSKRGITLIQKADDVNMSCGFGHAVYAEGFYKRKKGTPVFSEQ